MTKLFGLQRALAKAIQDLRDELAGGPRAELPPELELLGGLVHTREERAKTKEEPERELLAALPEAVHRALEGTARRFEMELTAPPRVLEAQVTPLLRGDVLVLLRDLTQTR